MILPGLILPGVVAAGLVFGGAPNGAPATEYVLRVETIGFEEVPADAEPLVAVLDAMELTVRTGVPFQARSVIGDRTIALSGRCDTAGSGRLRLHLRYSVQRDTGATVPTDLGEEKILSGSSVETTLDVEPGAAVGLGGVDTKSVSTTTQGTQTHLTRTRRLLRIQRPTAGAP